MQKKTAIIIGAGPAGLTAAYELLTRTEIKPIIFESSEEFGGIARTIKYKGNRIDIGGHRFFSKSDRVMDWWRKQMSIQGAPSKDDLLVAIQYHGKVKSLELSENGPDPEQTDLVMLVRNRLSRIYFLRKFFDYPISLKWQTISNLGAIRIIKIGISYIHARLFPIKSEISLEDFFINRFGKELYKTFFKDYTEKVWGVPCSKIKAEFGAQRIKGLSISKAITHALKSLVKTRNSSIAQKELETSLIEKFLYPKFGPGQMWEFVASEIERLGGEIHVNHLCTGLSVDKEEVSEVYFSNTKTQKSFSYVGNYVFSTMPIKDLFTGIKDKQLEPKVRDIATSLEYRDFITVGVLVKKLKIKNQTNTKTVSNIVPDNWIYIQERDVKVGRLQIFNNWSPYLVADPENTVWMGMEYFVNEGDKLWNKSDSEMSKFATSELSKISIIDESDVLDSVVIRVPKTYPAYWGSYEEMPKVIEYIEKIKNLFLIGRNGMHRYNNQDHSMLTAMVAVDNIIAERTNKANLWEINTEEEYQESKK